MKYKTIFTIVTIFIIAFIVGCNPTPGPNDKSDPKAPGVEPPEPPAQQWEHFKNVQKALGREVLSVAASQVWIEKHRDEISIPNQIEFGEPHIVSELPFIGTMIAVDSNGKRIVIRSPPPPPSPPPPGHLNEAKSLEWLSENGYEVEKSLNGSTTIKKGGRTRNIGHATVVGLELEKGVSLTAFDGKIYIKNEK